MRREFQGRKAARKQRCCQRDEAWSILLAPGVCPVPHAGRSLGRRTAYPGYIRYSVVNVRGRDRRGTGGTVGGGGNGARYDATAEDKWSSLGATAVIVLSQRDALAHIIEFLSLEDSHLVLAGGRKNGGYVLPPSVFSQYSASTEQLLYQYMQRTSNTSAY